MTVEEKRKDAFEEVKAGLNYLKMAKSIAKELEALANTNLKEAIDPEKYPTAASLQRKPGKVDYTDVQNNMIRILGMISSAQEHLLNAQTGFISASKQEEKEEKIKD